MIFRPVWIYYRYDRSLCRRPLPEDHRDDLSPDPLKPSLWLAPGRFSMDKKKKKKKKKKKYCCFSEHSLEPCSWPPALFSCRRADPNLLPLSELKLIPIVREYQYFIAKLTRLVIWTNSQIHHAGLPPNKDGGAGLPRLSSSDLARLPLSNYRKGLRALLNKIGNTNKTGAGKKIRKKIRCARHFAHLEIHLGRPGCPWGPPRLHQA